MNLDIFTETEPDLQWEWIPFEDGVCITGYVSAEEALQVPETIKSLPVRKIADDAFAYGLFLTVTLPCSLKQIGHKAFAFCVELQTIDLPEGLCKLDGSAFLSTQLHSLKLPDSLKELSRPENLDMRVYADASHPVFFADGNGLYKKTAEGGFELLSLYTDEEMSYEILPGTVKISSGAFFNVHAPIVLSLPKSLEETDSHAWEPLFIKSSSGKLREIRIHPDNRVFFADEKGIWKRTADGIILERWTGPDCADFDEAILALGPYSMTNRSFRRVTLPVSCMVEHAAFKAATIRMLCPDHSKEGVGAFQDDRECKEEILLPAGAVENNALLEKIFASGMVDLSPYDEMLTEGYLTPERIRMILHRLQSPLMPEFRKEKLLQRILSEGAKIADLLVNDADTASFETWLHLTGHTSATLLPAMEALFACSKKQQAASSEMLAALQRKRSTLTDIDEFDL